MWVGPLQSIPSEIASHAQYCRMNQYRGLGFRVYPSRGGACAELDELKLPMLLVSLSCMSDLHSAWLMNQ